MKIAIATNDWENGKNSLAEWQLSLAEWKLRLAV